MSFVTIEQARAWVGLDSSTIDDVRLQLLIESAEASFEDYCGVAAVPREYQQRFVGGVGEWYVDHRPLRSVTSIVDPAGNTIASNRYRVYEELGLIESLGYFAQALRADGGQDRWLVTYSAGAYPDVASIPATVKQGVLFLVSKGYYNPEPDVQSRKTGNLTISYIPNPSSSHVVPPEVERLWSTSRSRTI